MRKNRFFYKKKAFKLITQEQNVKYWETSKEHFDNEKLKKYSYTVKAHRNWTDEHNFGCTHFGMHPNLLPIDILRLDTFHMICQITKLIMHYIRDQLRKERFELRQQMLSVLGTKWKVDNLFLWA